jgi:hypothetical protein
MDISKFPSDLSGESTAQLQTIAKLIAKELENRGGFEGQLFTFLKKKEGKLLNKENKWVGGKVVALFEFRDESKKVKEFMLSTSCRGAKEPVEDTQSKYGDTHKYRLQFDPDDDMTIVGCYRE